MHNEFDYDEKGNTELDWDALATRPIDNPLIYDIDEEPIDIDTWVSYEPYHDEERLQIQRDSLRYLNIENAYGNIGFIYSKDIDKLEKYLEDVSKRITIEDTETVLETEVYYTSKIEGAKTTRKRTYEIHNGSPVLENDYSEAMIKGNFEAVKLLNLYGNKVNEEILYKAWDVLTTGCRDNEEIQGALYRDGQVGVSNSDFIAVEPEKIKGSMDKFFEFYNSNLLNDKPFIKATLIHYNFETIHPFCDGNGRMGRLLMNNYLISQGIESCRAVSFSEQIDKNRGEYDSSFVKSENVYSDATPFVSYMLETMAKSYATAMQVNKK